MAKSGEGGLRAAVVGGGGSGVLAAVRLLRAGARVVLIEPGEAGRGLAYGTDCLAHRLNVRVHNMSLFEERPDDFRAWLEANAPVHADPDGFAPRLLYGEYVADALAAAVEAAPDRFERRHARAVAVAPGPDGVRVRLEDGDEVAADHAVLALGNRAPSRPGLPGLDALPEGAVAVDPWAPGALDAIGPQDDVFLLGTGLTAIDVLLALDAKGWRGRALALSRRGLTPRPHEGPRAPGLETPPQVRPLSGALRDFRRQARARPWRALMDERRPWHPTLWASLTEAEKGRFLRHLSPWWDVARHRLDPAVAGRLAEIEAEGRLSFAAGRVRALAADPDGVRVEWRPRGGAETRTWRARTVVVCTGPEADPRRSEDPLVRDLLARGRARADAFGLGLDVAEDLRVLDAGGRPQPRLFAIGPLTRGTFWESVAMPEIRGQAARLAWTIAAASADPAASGGGNPQAGPRASETMLDRLFLKHPRAAGESYAAHLIAAWAIGARLIGYGAACLVHGLLPSVFTTTGSDGIRKLNDELQTRRRRCDAWERDQAGKHDAVRPD